MQGWHPQTSLKRLLEDNSVCITQVHVAHISSTLERFCLRCRGGGQADPQDQSVIDLADPVDTDELTGDSGRGGGAAQDAEGGNAQAEPGECECPRRTKHVALAFYGLTRSLGYTIDSIRQNIFGPLSEAGYTYDVYLHTYDLQHLANARTGEAAALNTSEWQLLQPDFYKVTRQACTLRCTQRPCAKLPRRLFEEEAC